MQHVVPLSVKVCLPETFGRFQVFDVKSRRRAADGAREARVGHGFWCSINEAPVQALNFRGTVLLLV